MPTARRSRSPRRRATSSAGTSRRRARRARGPSSRLRPRPSPARPRTARETSASATFRVSVRDTTAPVFSQVPVGPVVEADGPGGSRATYTPPIAVDLVNGPVLVSCTPAPGSIFPRGTTTVTCSAKDARGNTATASFPVKVVDTTKPALNVPQPQDVSSNGAQTLSRDDPQVQRFLHSAQARDSVDGSLPVKNDAPAVLPLGKTRITFTATDSSGNTATGQAELNVVTGAVSPTKQDTTPPKDVTRLKAKPGDRFVVLTWVKPTADFDHLRVSRAPGKNGAPMMVVYSGSGERAEGHEAHERRRVPLCRRRLRQGRELLTRHRRSRDSRAPAALCAGLRRGGVPGRPSYAGRASQARPLAPTRSGLPGSVVEERLSPGRRSSAPGRRRHS